ncbi:uncharacterized protein LOC143562406 [Bidens hawaiensis]|uniref:uncharacterized protein LOC143562406 n=1 Tax=Bidens hawaiensis TaxID=980011 RepID=UPI004049C7F2
MAKSRGGTIDDENNISREEQAKAMIFLRHHLHEDLKREYLTVEDPLELWKNIQQRFDYQKLVIVPKALYEWLHLRLQDYKTVSEYNSALFRITFELKLCGEKIAEADMLEKSFSTIHASNILLSQTYRERNFTKYSELITLLLVAEQNNTLLLKNHQARPVGSSPFPEANATTHKTGRGRGRSRGPSRGRGRGRGQINTWRKESYHSKPRNGESSQQEFGAIP